MIHSLNLQNVGRYHNETTMEELDRVNFVYGANGSGKSTIARFVKHIQSNDDDITGSGSSEESQIDEFQHCSLTTTSSPSNVRYEVYDQEFVRALFDQDAASMEGLFTVSENAVLTRQIEELEAQLSENEQSLEVTEGKIEREERGKKVGARASADAALKALNSRIFDRSKPFRLLLRDTPDLAGTYIHQRGNEAKFATNFLLERPNAPDVPVGVTVDEIVKDFNRIKTGNRFQSVSRPQMPNIDIDLLSQLLPTSIVTAENSPLQKLIDEMQAKSEGRAIGWVQEGLDLAQHSQDQCPFCQRTFDDGQLRQIAEIFDAEFRTNSKFISEALPKVVNSARELRGWCASHNSTLPTDLFNNTRIVADQIASQLDDLSEILSKKRENLALLVREQIDFQGFDRLHAAIENLNGRISVHNQALDDHQTSKARLQGLFFALMIAEVGDLTAEYDASVESKNLLSQLENQKREQGLTVAAMRNQIRDLQSQLTSINVVVDNMNTTLRCFGFDTFCLETTSDNLNYRVIRQNGENAIRLSEGERTFIAFLYFYHRVLNTDQLEKKIVVIDDPICSLDHMSLFIARQMTREICETAAHRREGSRVIQTIVLTHNAFFFEEIAARHRRDYWQKFKYFWIRKGDVSSEIVSLGANKPVHGTYRGLWMDLYDENVPHRLKPNLMRRILEHHYLYLGDVESLTAVTRTLDGAHQRNAAALIGALHSSSHNIFDDIDFHEDIEACNLLRVSFEEILTQTGQSVHLQHMKDLAQTQTTRGN